MPITSIRLRNFKCFADSGDIPLRPLTLLFGRNNTGKSTILQSLLVLRQSLDSDLGARLDLRGPLYHAGSYADIVHQHRSTESMTMTFRAEVAPDWRGEVELEFGSAEPEPPRLSRLQVNFDGSVPLVIRRGRGRGGPYEMWIGEHSLGGEAKDNFRFAPTRFLPRLGGGFPTTLAAAASRRVKLDADIVRAFAPGLLHQFERDLRDMRTVGAFRNNPRRRYESLGLVPKTLDAAGEEVVNALIEDVTRRRGSTGQLFRSVNQWLKTIGGVRMLPLRRISKTARIFEIRLKDIDSGRWANFADVGFGIGQALPVLVEGLRTPVGGLFTVQEPEIHLHPDAQLAMADFLISLARAGTRVIAETHSEHILLRVRHAVTKRAPDLAREDVSIVYVDKTKAGTSRARRLEMDELGQIGRWPGGFMEEATRERIAIMKEMAARARTRR